MSILVINAGSSSVKFTLFRFETLESIARGMLDWGGDEAQAMVTLTSAEGESLRMPVNVPDYRSGVIEALRVLREYALTDSTNATRVVGHRLIHGGEEIRRPVRIDSKMKQTITRFADLAPLHIPPGLEAIEATENAMPDIPQVGVFDTAFFANMPAPAYLYPVPYKWYTDWGIRRFGFHGTSHAYCTDRAAEMLGAEINEPRLVICHLGQGSSATAVRGKVAVMNTMGFTPLEGLMMGTRSGTLDPGILLHLLREKGMTPDDLDEILHHQSGLLGVSGLSPDFRKVEEAAIQGHAQAQLAMDVLRYRISTAVGGLAVAAGGLDALIFTGGIGENAHRLRSQISEDVACLGVYVDKDKNRHCRPDTDVATAESPARVLVIHTREDLVIARACRRAILETP